MARPPRHSERGWVGGRERKNLKMRNPGHRPRLSYFEILLRKVFSGREDVPPIREHGNVLECGSRTCRFGTPLALLEHTSATWRSGTPASSPAGVAASRAATLLPSLNCVDLGPLSRPTTGGGKMPPGQPARRQRSACGILTLAPDRDSTVPADNGNLRHHPSLPVAYKSGSCCGYRTPKRAMTSRYVSEQAKIGG